MNQKIGLFTIACNNYNHHINARYVTLDSPTEIPAADGPLLRKRLHLRPTISTLNCAKKNHLPCLLRESPRTNFLITYENIAQSYSDARSHARTTTACILSGAYVLLSTAAAAAAAACGKAKLSAENFRLHSSTKQINIPCGGRYARVEQINFCAERCSSSSGSGPVVYYESYWNFRGPRARAPDKKRPSAYRDNIK